MSQIVNIPEVLFFQEGPGVRKSQFTNKGVKLLNVGNINNNKINLNTTEKYISEEEAYGKYSHFLVEDGDLLIACSGIVVNNFHNKISFITKSDLPLCLNTSTMRFKSLDENKLYINFFYYFLMTISFKKQIGQLITGSAQLNFGPSHIQKIKMPLPSLDQQKQIAKTLDKANELINLRKESITKLDELSKSIFIDMFGDLVSNPMNWEINKLKQFLNNIDSGWSPVCNSYPRKENNNGILKLSALTDDKYHQNENKEMIQKDEPKLEHLVLKNDLLFSRKNTYERVGCCAYVFDTEDNLFMPDLIFRLNTTSKVNKIYLWKYLSNETVKIRLRSIASGASASMPNISKTKLLDFNIFLPPLTLQNKFAKTIKKIEEQKTLYTQELEKLQENFDALLQKSFQE